VNELGVDEVAQVVAGHGVFVVDLAIDGFRSGPAFPTAGRVENETAFFAFERSLCGLVLLQRIEILEEQQPRALLGAVQFAGAASVFVQDVVYVFEGLFEHRQGVIGLLIEWLKEPTQPGHGCTRAARR